MPHAVVAAASQSEIVHPGWDAGEQAYLVDERLELLRLTQSSQGEGGWFFTKRLHT